MYFLNCDEKTNYKKEVYEEKYAKAYPQKHKKTSSIIKFQFSGTHDRG